MTEKVPITREGFRKLEVELKRLKAEERPKIIAAIEEARAHGDLSENAEYEAAKDAQAMLQAKMVEIEDHLARAQVIDTEKLSGNRVVFGATVHLMDFSRDMKLKYQLVGEDEADLPKGKISIKSPLGRALVGKKEGEIFVFQSPAGERELEIEQIRFG
jgi:transcription elongation factor GreA